MAVEAAKAKASTARATPLARRPYCRASEAATTDASGPVSGRKLSATIERPALSPEETSRKVRRPRPNHRRKGAMKA